VSCARCALSDATKNMLNVARIGRETANSPIEACEYPA